MNRLSIKLKIFLLVTVFFSISLAATAYYNYNIVLKELKTNEQQQASTLLNTLVPMIAAPLSFDSIDGAIDVIEKIHMVNKEIEETVLTVFTPAQTIKLENRLASDKYGIFTLIEPIKDISTDELIAEIKITFYRKHYEQGVKNTKDFLIRLIIFYFSVITIP